MKDDDQRFAVQAVNFSKAVRVRPITQIARLRIRTVSPLDPNRTPRDVRLGSEMRSRSGTKPPSHSKRTNTTVAYLL
jgi:hypothetical protein